MIYLDNAATSFPKPRCLSKTMMDCLRYYCGNPGRSGHFMSMKTASKIYDSRSKISELFHIEDPLQVIFTSNTTDALNLAIQGVLSPGDHVITTSMEHNSVLRPLSLLPDITVTVVGCGLDGYMDPEEIRCRLRQNTKLIITTHSSNVTGTIFPIEKIGELARKNRSLYLVDAAQSAGYIPIDLEKMNVDMMAFAGHKGLLGPQGTGFLYVRKGLDLKPLKAGGTGTDSRNVKQPRTFPEGYEPGTVNSPGIIGLGATVDYISRIGLQDIREHEVFLSDFLYSELCNIQNVALYGPYDARLKTPVVSFNIDGIESEEVCHLLDSRYGIAARSGFHCAPLAHDTIGSGNAGTVRLSLGCFNTLPEIKQAVNAVYQISKGKK